MNKLNVGVFMGGKSIEREVSFNSGRTVCDHLDTNRYNVVPIFQMASGDLFVLPWHFLHRGKTSDFEHRLVKEAQKITWDDLKTVVDFIFLAMHGRFAEDGTIQGFLEILGIPYLGSKVFASSLSMNKIMQKKFLQHNNIAVPNGIIVYYDQLQKIDDIIQSMKQKNISFPCIVKPSHEGSSMGVQIVAKQKDLKQALHKAATVSSGITQPVLIEEKLCGMEFTCITITDYKTGEIIALPPTEVIIEEKTSFFDYTQKYMPGKANEVTPPRCSQENTKKIQQTCVSVTNILGMSNTSRTDGFLLKDGTIVIVDPNSLTGMGPSSFFFREAAHIGMSHTNLINHLIETELHHYKMLETVMLNEKKSKKTQNKIKVAVLFCGNTHEKEISLESGRNITYKLSPQKYSPIPLFVSHNMELFAINQTQLVLNSTTEIAHSLKQTQKIEWNDLPTIADFVFIALHGGKGENGCVQGALDMLGLPYNGSGVLASALCADKFKTNRFLNNDGFDVPQATLIHKKKWKENCANSIQAIVQSFQFPLIIKPHNDGCSMFVKKIKNQAELELQIEMFFSQSDKDIALIEQCIEGMELTVGVLGDKKPQALPPSQTVTTADILSIEEKFLPGAGENQTPAPLSAKTIQKIQKTVEQVYKSVGCFGYARIDCFYQSKEQSPTGIERIVILEINTLPGMTPATCLFHQAAEVGIRPMEFIDTIVKMGLNKNAKKPLTKGKKPSNMKTV